MQIPEVLLLKQFYFMLIKNVGLLLYIAGFWGAGLQCRTEATVWVLHFLKFLVEISEALLVNFEWICAAVLWRTEQCFCRWWNGIVYFGCSNPARSLHSSSLVCTMTTLWCKIHYFKIQNMLKNCCCWADTYQGEWPLALNMI